MRIKYIILYIIVLLILYIIKHYYSNIETFTDKKSIAIILRGESFRVGSMYNRNIGTDESYEEQMSASTTHNTLAEKIESLGYNVDIYIDTYSTKYDNDLLSIYASRVKGYKFHKSHLESQAALLKDSIELLEESLNNYDAILIVRLDLFLKDKYINDYNPDIKTIQFFSITWYNSYKTPNGNPRINDTIFHYPKQYYDRLQYLYTIDNLHNLLDIDPAIYDIDYTLLTTKYYDSDSEKDFNPYYKMVGRKENTVWHSEGKEFPRDF